MAKWNFIVGAVAFLALGLWMILGWRQKRLVDYEKIPRWRNLGIFFGAVALAMCVPHAEAVVPATWQQGLWPAAITIGFLSYFFADYLLARGLSGFWILLSYYYIHIAFEEALTGRVLLTILSWILVVAAVAFSARPCWMRDLIRSGCRHWWVRSLTGVFCFVYAITLAVASSKLCFSY